MSSGFSAMTRPQRAYYQTLGQQLRQARQRKGMTQRELGQRIGMSHVAIHYYETAKHEVTIWTARQLEIVLGQRIEP